jgi:hypothetical protein
MIELQQQISLFDPARCIYRKPCPTQASQDVPLTCLTPFAFNKSPSGTLAPRPSPVFRIRSHPPTPKSKLRPAQCSPASPTTCAPRPSPTRALSRATCSHPNGPSSPGHGRGSASSLWASRSRKSKPSRRCRRRCCTSRTRARSSRRGSWSRVGVGASRTGRIGISAR